MRIYSVHGVVYFHVYPFQKHLLNASFFNNKTFLSPKDNGEIWVFDYTIPDLLISQQTYFNTVATRDFYSDHKEVIFQELGLIENENGVFSLSTYKGSIISDFFVKNSVFIGNGFPQLGDTMNGQKIKNMNIEYNIVKNNFRGSFDF